MRTYLRRCYATQVQLVPKPRCYLLHTALSSPHHIYAADGHYTPNSSCKTLFWLHNNHKMSISYHKSGLVSIVTKPLADGLFLCTLQ